jgi:carboxypeptidase Taq
MNPSFEILKNKLGELADIKGAIALMMWDQEVMMPKGSIHLRARQLGTLSGMQHEKFVKETGEILSILNDQQADLNAHEQQDLAEVQREYTRMTRVPTQLIIDLQKGAAEAQHAWELSRKANDFSVFAPALSNLVALRLQEAQCLGHSGNPYDAMLDCYERDASAASLEKLFVPMRQQLTGLIHAIQAAPQVDDSFLYQPISPQAQLAFSEKVLEKMGYDFTTGRQDISTHPFTIGMGSQDIRITTRVKENDIIEMLYSSIHEGGHALYEQGISMENYGLPSGEYCSIGIHESQSRIWENNVGRSLAFWEHWFPTFRELFPDKLAGKGPEDVFKAVNKVSPSFIRTSADELTYHFHIMLRFEIENLLINGSIKVNDLPSVWNELLKNYLGIGPPDLLNGVLQDVHWSHGSFGYFPTYSLGSFYAAQFMAKAGETLPDLQKSIEKGEFSAFRNWLKINVHQKGRSGNPENLCKSVCGEGLNVEFFIDYAKEKFEAVYGIRI